MPKKQTKKHPTSVKSRIHTRVKLAVVPHKANQYRPHLIRRYGLVTLLFVIIIGQFTYNAVQSNVLGAQAQVTAAGLLAATNQARSDSHEAPLTINADLAKAAQLKAENMFAQQYWAHTAPDGTTPWHWFGVVGYSYAAAGENLAKNFTTSATTVNAWMASSEHRANILKPAYTDVGFATMQGMLGGNPTTLTVALYGAPETVAVQGARVVTDAPTMEGSLSLMDRFGLGLQSLTPVAMASIVVLICAANIALLAHLYRKKLPLTLRRGWYRHHGIYKAIGLASLAVVMVFAYSGIGQV